MLIPKVILGDELMRALTKYTIISLGAVMLAGGAALASFAFFSGEKDFNLQSVQNAVAGTLPINNSDLEKSVTELGEINASSIDAKRVGENTKMVYQYYYLKDGVVEKSTEVAPYFLVGLSQFELAEKLMGWEIVSFANDEIVLEKKINQKSTPNYTIGIKDGFVAVFYDDVVGESNIKEVTDMPITALSEEEQARLLSGIRVKSEDELLKVLEDYGS